MVNFPHNRPVIDMHTHVHPDMATVLVDIMETNNLVKVVNLGVLEALDIPFQDGMHIFRETLGDLMLYFTTPDFGDPSPGFGERMAESLKRKVEAGACGVKIFKELGLRHRDAEGNLIPVDDPRLDSLWAAAGELEIPVLIHTADPVAFFQPLDETNERLEELQAHPDWYFGEPGFPGHDALLTRRNRVIERHPDTTFIGAHLGNYSERLAYVGACLERYPNFYVDTSARLGEIGRLPTEEVREFFVKHQERIIFGTDLVLGWNAFNDPSQKKGENYRDFYDTHWRFFETDARQMDHPFPIQGRWKVNAINLPDEVTQKLYLRNARRLIPGL